LKLSNASDASESQVIEMAEPAIPLPASTVVLVRPDKASGFEIFMNRRPDKIDVYAGVYVFPGGRVEKSDYAPAMLQLTRGLTAAEARRQLGGKLEAELCVGHWVAAVRELYEEAGVHFFVPKLAAADTLLTDDLSERLAHQREQLQQGKVDLASLLAGENLRCDLARLSYFFHRVTPEHYPVRFDTHFYIAALPPHQTPLQRSEEVSDSLWITADEALARSLSGNFPMMPPTVAVLRTLAAHGSWNALKQAFRLR
jgi:8-oxo-dGTP pyrophosphatase MutT (NUDIX family)